MSDSCNPLDCSPPGFSVQGIVEARVLEWVAISFSRGSSQPKDWNSISCTGRQILYHWATGEAVYHYPHLLMETQNIQPALGESVPVLRLGPQCPSVSVLPAAKGTAWSNLIHHPSPHQSGLGICSFTMQSLFSGARHPLSLVEELSASRWVKRLTRRSNAMQENRHLRWTLRKKRLIHLTGWLQAPGVGTGRQWWRAMHSGFRQAVPLKCGL